MEDFKNTNLNSSEPEGEFHKEYLEQFNNESDETEISEEYLDFLKDTNPDLYYEIMNKMMIKSESEIDEMLNDPEFAKQKEIENIEKEKAEFKKAIEDLYKNDPNESYWNR